MKIRNGFVSNSSTTSFCIYGVDTDLSVLDKFMEKSGSDDEDDDDRDVAAEKFEEEARDLGLVVFTDFENEVVFIGRDPETMGDDETGREFKTSTKDKITKLLGKKAGSCSWMAEEIRS
jgi:hypothetical protein